MPFSLTISQSLPPSSLSWHLKMLCWTKTLHRGQGFLELEAPASLLGPAVDIAVFWMPVFQLFGLSVLTLALTKALLNVLHSKASIESSRLEESATCFLTVTPPTKLPYCRVSLLRSALFHSLQPRELQPVRLLSPPDFPGKNIGVGCHFLLQVIFLSPQLTSLAFILQVRCYGEHVRQIGRVSY